MEDLFAQETTQAEAARQNLAARMRSANLDEFKGQQHILAAGKLLRRLIDSDRLTAALFYGPPGTGKTTLARLVSRLTDSAYVELSGVESSVAQIRKTVEQADILWRSHARRTILLVDEIHRFNKGQQDALLPHVERGAIRLIGATTENPFFYVNAALVSRLQVFEFLPLTCEEIVEIMQQALANEERGLGSYAVKADEEALRFIASVCDGDARKALNALEVGVLTTPANPSDERIHFTRQIAEESIQKRSIRYDHDGDEHYDTISAFIKCVRASEPDAALYWLGKMLIAGEDIRFIARRLVILAAEDIGLAEPAALPLAVACQQAVATLGMPEARIPLSETTIYLATAPKSNSAITAIDTVMEDIRSGSLTAVPGKVRDAHYAGAKSLGRGEGYQYAHAYQDAIAPEAIMPDVTRYYEPTRRGYERTISERLERWEARRLQLQPSQPSQPSHNSPPQ